MMANRQWGHRGGALYIETEVRTSLDELWNRTQDPKSHVRWDARFSSIVPTRTRSDGAQEFAYSLKLGLMTIRGTGTSLGERRGRDGTCTSALVFESDSVLSPLKSGRGYWRYIPTEHGVRFITGYDYRPGWGKVGRILDPILTRPLVWWLTAWSFDRLRLWIERGVEPERIAWWNAWIPGRVSARARRCSHRPRTSQRAGIDGSPGVLARLAQQNPSPSEWADS